LKLLDGLKRTIFSRIFRYREIATRTKFDACCCDTDKKNPRTL
jgi:hypothetical protein